MGKNRIKRWTPKRPDECPKCGCATIYIEDEDMTVCQRCSFEMPTCYPFVGGPFSGDHHSYVERERLLLKYKDGKCLYLWNDLVQQWDYMRKIKETLGSSS